MISAAEEIARNDGDMREALQERILEGELEKIVGLIGDFEERATREPHLRDLLLDNLHSQGFNLAGQSKIDFPADAVSPSTATAMSFSRRDKEADNRGRRYVMEGKVEFTETDSLGNDSDDSANTFLQIEFSDLKRGISTKFDRNGARHRYGAHHTRVDISEAAQSMIKARKTLEQMLGADEERQQ